MVHGAVGGARKARKDKQKDDEETTTVVEDMITNVLLSVLCAGLGWLYQALM